MSDLFRAAVVAVAVAALAACGGDAEKPGAASSAGPSATVTASGSGPATSSAPGTATTSPGAQPSGNANAPGGGGPSAGPTGGPGSTTAPSARPTPAQSSSLSSRVELNARLSRTCVTPGGSLTLTLTGRPGMRVIFNTTYSDGKDGQVHGGKEMEGRTDAGGAYSKTWTVSVTAPMGDADVYVGAVDGYGVGQDHLRFKVARSC